MKPRLLSVLLASVVVLTSILFHQPVAQAELLVPEALVLVLKPGESGRISILVDPHAPPGQISSLELWGIADPFEGEPHYGRCWAQVSARGADGWVYWSWETEEIYTYDRRTVIQEDYNADYQINHA